jgi:hypothetical protein
MDANDTTTRSYSTAEHNVAMVHVRCVLENGGTIAQAATELRIPKNTVYTWYGDANGRRRKKVKAKATTKFSPVRVVPDPTPVSPVEVRMLAGKVGQSGKVAHLCVGQDLERHRRWRIWVSRRRNYPVAPPRRKSAILRDGPGRGFTKVVRAPPFTDEAQVGGSGSPTSVLAMAQGNRQRSSLWKCPSMPASAPS